MSTLRLAQALHLASLMANPNSVDTDAPHAHEGVHYDNPSTKPLRGRVARADRDGVQRVVWALFFVLILGAIATGVVLSVVHPPL